MRTPTVAGEEEGRTIWMDNLEADLKTLKMKDWRLKTSERATWRLIVSHLGL